MRTAAAITGAILLGVFAGRAMGAEVPVVSRIETVTVFPSGAEATRAARLSLEKGEHTLVISDLPAEVVPGSIRVDGKATAGLDIQSVDTRRRYIPRADQEALQAERKSIEDEIEKLRDERGLIQGQEDAAQAQKTLLNNLAQMPGRPQQPEEGQPAPGAQPLPRTDWQQVLSLIGTGMVDAQRSALDAEVKKRDLDRRIEELEKKLAALAPGRAEQTEVKVFVVAGAALEADLTVRYQVPSASWAPRYDARLVTGSKTSPPALELARRADITQRTGENWDNVALLLSTTRPTANASAPTVETVTVDFAPEPRPAASVSAPVAPAPYANYDGLSERKSKRSVLGLSGGEAAADAAPALEIAEQGAAAEVAPFQAVFAVPGRPTVPATGELKRVFLQQDQIEPGLTVRTVPKLDAKAYLYAKLVLPKGAPVLPGAVSLFRDGTFVGSGALPALSPGEDYELGFGADDQVRVRHAIADEKRGETGLISSAKTDSRNFRITVKNMHERAVELVVQDQVPVSQNEDIKVEYVGPTPSKKDVDGKRGVITFESKLGPEEERQIEFGYRVIWPGARSIVYH